MPQDLPARFGRYELLERLAVGGMAEVFLARSFGVEGFEKRVVIKRILPELARSPRFVNLFIQEAKICGALEHPNVVQIFELGRVGEDPYIAMEYIHGRDLARVLRHLRQSNRRLPVRLALYIVASVLRGLAYVHDRTDALGRPLALVHQDVSPQNVLVTFQGDVKLVDFGIARLRGELGAGTGRAGKRAYMSPEQARGLPVDARADVYGAGVVLYELLTGRKLAAGGGPTDENGPVPPEILDVRAINPEVSDRLWDLLRAMLSWEPDTRLAPAAAAEDALREELHNSGLRADASELGAFLRELFADEANEPSGLVVPWSDAELGESPSPPPPSAPDLSPVSAEPGNPASFGPGELKPAVVLVAEINGLTELSLVHGTGEVVRRHFQLLRRIRRTVDRYGGVLGRFNEDTLVVFFGLPRAGAHDVERALAAAEALHRAARALARQGLNVGLSIGVHHGQVAAGWPGGRELRVLGRGDSVKLAHRLAAAADPGQTLTSEEVARAAEDRYQFAVGPVIQRKGRPGAAVQARLLVGRQPGWLLLAGKPSSGRWLRRGDELDQLKDALATVAGGTGGVGYIGGTVGLGKTRLLRELRELARGRGVPFHAARAEPFSDDLPFTPFRDLVCGMLGLAADASRAVAMSQLERLRQIGLVESDLAVLAVLVGAGEVRAVPSREAILGTASRLVLALARERPLVLALDDVHNLSGIARHLLAHVVRVASKAPVLFLFTGVGDLAADFGAPTWSVTLGPLPPAAQEALLAERCGAARVDRSLAQRVAETAEGNPLYVSELVRALQRAGHLELRGDLATLANPDAALHLPLELESLIASRIDALGPTEKAGLNVAAVIGPAFDTQLLAGVLGLADVRGLVATLVGHGLLVGEGVDPSRYSFASSLVWEAVHRSILDGQRRALHGRIAAAIEQTYGDDLDTHRPSLAVHLAAAGMRVAASEHALRIALGLRQQQYLEQAVAWCERGIGWLGEIESGEVDEARDQEIRLRLTAGELWALVGQGGKAIRHLELALDLAEEGGEAGVEARALLALGRLCGALGRAEQAAAYLDTALSLSGREREIAVEVLEALGLLALDQGQLGEARARFEEGLARAGDDDVLAARALLGLATAELREGREPQAVALLHQALQKADTSGDRILAGRVLNNIGIAHYQAGRYAEALERFRRALEIREGLGYRRGVVVNLHNVGDTWLRLGEPGRAWAAFQRSVEVAREIGWERGVVMNEAFLAFIEGTNAAASGLGAEVEPAVVRLQAAALDAERLVDPETGIVARWLLGRLLNRIGRSTDATRVLNEAHARAVALDAAALVRDIDSERGGGATGPRPERAAG